ncbi:hypothetical protein R3P38DRAFT_3189257 [Favolaschia claudopus]|uniref:Uncharacterized protein n=1 Tax=Favolaschia claudopus TaxID=2862362 RepID=A0AAW0BS24_9AGAR
MPANDVRAPHPQHVYAADVLLVSCLPPPPTTHHHYDASTCSRAVAVVAVAVAVAASSTSSFSVDNNDHGWRVV